MESWLRIGVPILIAVLLIVAAVSITVDVTRDNTIRQVTAAVYAQERGDSSQAVYIPNKADSSQYAQAGLCPSCPGYRQANNNPTADQGTTTGLVNGYACGNCNTQGSSQGTIGNARGGCCRGR